MSAYRVKYENLSLNFFTLVPSSKTSGLCVFSVKGFVSNVPYKSLKRIARYGISVVFGRTIVPLLVCVSISVTIVLLLIVAMPTLFLFFKKTIKT